MLSELMEALVPNDMSDSDKAILVLCEATAWTCIYFAWDFFLSGKPKTTALFLLGLGIFFAYSGFKWPAFESRLARRFPQFTAKIVAVITDYKFRIVGPLILLSAVVLPVTLYLHSLGRDVSVYTSQRAVSQKQADKLREYLSKRDPHALSIRVVWHDLEAMGYAGQLFSAFSQTNWDINPPNHGGPEYQHIANPLPRPKPNDRDAKGELLYKNIDEYMAAHETWLDAEISVKVGEQLNDTIGLCIEVEMPGQPANPDPRHPTPESVLQDAMRYAGIEVNCGGSAYNRDRYNLYLLVGHKSLATDQGSSLRLKLVKWLMSWQ